MRSIVRLLPLALFLATLSTTSCECGVTPAEGEGEGGGEGEGEGDTDGGVPDAGEPQPPTEPIRPPNPDDPRNPDLDSDCDGLSDQEEFTVVYPGDLRTSPGDYDSDDDGIADGIEAGRDQDIDIECPATWKDRDTTTRTSPVAVDSDGDCIGDGLEDANHNGRVDDGESSPSSIDSDGDGLSDGQEDANCDGSRSGRETNPGLADTDGDGLNDGFELGIGTDPNVADSDGDGISDGDEVASGSDPLLPEPDDDHDGVPNANDASPNNPDADGDGLCDGNLTVAGTCIAGEDRNGNGRADSDESDPSKKDTDCDGAGDLTEQNEGSQPRLTDSDGDGLSDGLELGATGAVAGSGCPAPAQIDSDPGSHTLPTDADSDNDGMNDGLEDRDRDGAVDAANPAPGAVRDTDPNEVDTDGDGRCDGAITVAGCLAGEDLNKNGVTDAGETNPRVADDGEDTDHDGLTTTQETQFGTDANDADTDGDGLEDGAEALTLGTDPTSADSDCDGLSDGEEDAANTDANLADTDGDGILDGVELGKVALPVPNACPSGFVGDQDSTPGHNTDPNDDDSDNDGVLDGAEDGNQNGRVDGGELDPNNGGDVTGPVTAACATPIEPGLFPNGSSDVLLALPPDIAAGDVHPIVSQGEEVGLSGVNAARGIAMFTVRRAPVGASTTAHRQAIEATLGAQLSLPLTQDNLTTWDGFDLSRSTYTLTVGGTTATEALNLVRAVLGDNAATATFSNLPNESGPWKLGVAVVRRSAQSAVVTVALTKLAQLENPASGRDFRLEDLVGGTALGQVGDRIGTQCEVQAAQENQPVDFFFILDNSGSMGDELDAVGRAVSDLSSQLGNSALDFRISMLTTEFNQRLSGPTFGGNGQGTCEFADASRVCACEFTRTLSAFEACVATTADLGGSGAEGSYGALQEALNDVFLPSSAAEDPRKLRTGATVVTIVVSDAGEQSPQLANRRDPYLPSVDNNSYFNGSTLQPKLATDIANSPTFWTNFFAGGAGAAGWDPAANSNEPPILINGILCPFSANCAGEQDSTGPEAPVVGVDSNGDDFFRGESFARDRHYTVMQNRSGVIGSIAAPDGTTLQNVDDITPTITGIVNTVIGSVSPYPLAKDPIASTIKVAVEGPVFGPACDLNDVPRSRVNGFAYDADTNSITFFGDCRPSDAGTDVVISYRTWIDGTPDPDGVDCSPPFVVVGDQCLCPSDCGNPGGLGNGQTCDSASCTVGCLADCGGCGPGQVCDPDPDVCSCSCPADCNTAGGPPPGFTCDPATCLPTCAANGCDPGDRPVGPGWECGASCEWECPADCGDPDNLGATERCNRTTCTIECAPDCNATCGGGFQQCDNSPGVCACECVESATCAPGFVFDAGACGCVCDTGALACPATHEPNLDACRCDCADNCGGACTDGTACQASTCQCITTGG